MRAVTLFFRADEDLASQTRAIASALGLRRSDYLREAVREKNARVTAERIAGLSRELAAEHLVFNEGIEASLTDGLERGLRVGSGGDPGHEHTGRNQANANASASASALRMSSRGMP